MTVCVAAMCQWQMLNQTSPCIVAASDRMITSADVQFEPPSMKLWPLTTSIYALSAGDASDYVELWQRTVAEVIAWVSAHVNQWISVSRVADIYSRKVVEYRKEVMSRLVLEPLGLDWHTFATQQTGMSQEWLQDITDKILEFKAGCRAIITGIDDSGAHIYVVNGHGQIRCYDSVGFAAIGAGQRHAESHFMFSGHTRWANFAETFLRVYVAKKRAEVAPGVGGATDMVIIPAQGAATLFVDERKDEQVDKIYLELIRQQDEATQRANKAVADYIREQFETAARELAEDAKASAQSDVRQPSDAPKPTVPEKPEPNTAN